MNYKIILDETKLKDFIDWLPDLKNDECYYLTLFSRKKYCNTLSGDKQCLKRLTTNKEYMFDKIKQLECEIGCYKQNGNPIPQEALALYITINPRSYVKATVNVLKKFIDIILQEYNDYNPHQLVLSEIQTAKSKTIFYDIDFDNVQFDIIKDEIINKNIINPDCLYVLHTRGGFHLLVEIEKISNEFKKSWYKNITNLSGIDVTNSDLMPIPGCHQGGFTPYFEKFFIIK
ncbi:hypothetical protein M0Q97_03790 [Candidatus Dojkabacteria bacterium]|jgi:hypothetical protein|nr:hypothetical protein [Candidatus Dojkabacteria bacterium]